MKRFLAIIFILLLCYSPINAAQHRIFPAYDGLTGGSEGKLDNIDACNADGRGYNLQNKDGAMVWDQSGGDFYFYIFNSTSGASESSPDVITPDSCNGTAYTGNGRWIKSSSGSGEVSISGTPSQYEWALWTDASTIEGVSVSGDSVVCTNSNGKPEACSNLSDSSYELQDSDILKADTDDTITARIGQVYQFGVAQDGDPGNAKVYDIITVNINYWNPGGLSGTDNYRIIVTSLSGSAIDTFVIVDDATGKAYGSATQVPFYVCGEDAGRVLTASELNCIWMATGAGDFDIPADQCDTVTSQILCVKQTATHNNAITSNDASDQFILYDGTALTAGNELDLPQTAGGQVCVKCAQANKWWVFGEMGGHSTDGGAAD